MVQAYNQSAGTSKKFYKILQNQSFQAWLKFVKKTYKTEATKSYAPDTIGAVTILGEGRNKRYFTLFPDVVLFAASRLSRSFELSCVESLIRHKTSNENLIQRIKAAFEVHSRASAKRSKSDALVGFEE